MILDEKKGEVRRRLGSGKTKESGGRSQGAEMVKLSPGWRVVERGIFTSLCLDLVSIVSRVSRAGGAD